MQAAFKAVATALPFLLAASASGVGTSALDWPGDAEQTYMDGPFSLGYRFRVSGDANIRAVSLGAYDMGRDGLSAPHEVGIWSVLGGPPLVSATVSAGAGSVLFGHLRYVPCTPITLVAGQEYVVAAADYGVGFDPYSWDPPTISIDPRIEFLHNRSVLTRNNNGLHFPTEETSFSTYGWFGGSFQFEVVPSAPSIVPIGLGGMLLARRRRAR